MKKADILKSLIYKRTGLKPKELVCPREKTEMTPCICRDGNLAMLNNKTCVGCGINVNELLEIEYTKKS